MSTCPSCSTSVSDQERFCEACGADLAPRRSLRRLRHRRGPDAADAADDRATGTGDQAPPGATVESPWRRRSAPPAAAASPRTATAARAARARPGPATTSSSSPRPGSPPCATAASGTPATRTRWPWPRTPSRAPAPCSWSATGSRPRSTPTWPAWPAPAPRVTVLATSSPHGLGTASSRVALITATLVKATDAANAAVLAATADGSPSPASCTLVAGVLDGEPAGGRLGAATAVRTGCRTSRREPAHGGRLVRRGAGRRGGAPSRRRERPARPRHHALARAGRPRPHPPHRLPAGSTPRAGCWSARTACGTTAPKRPTSLRWSGRLRRRAGRRRRSWPGRWSTGPTQQGGRDNISVALARYDPA